MRISDWSSDVCSSDLPTRPARAYPRALHAAIARFAVTDLFGSPALLAVLARHGQPLPGLKRVISAGAPVPAAVLARVRSMLPAGAKLWHRYGDRHRDV